MALQMKFKKKFDNHVGLIRYRIRLLGELETEATSEDELAYIEQELYQLNLLIIQVRQQALMHESRLMVQEGQLKVFGHE